MFVVSILQYLVSLKHRTLLSRLSPTKERAMQAQWFLPECILVQSRKQNNASQMMHMPETFDLDK